jgi:hypothetical protein
VYGSRRVRSWWLRPRSGFQPERTRDLQPLLDWACPSERSGNKGRSQQVRSQTTNGCLWCDQDGDRVMRDGLRPNALHWLVTLGVATVAAGFIIDSAFPGFMDYCQIAEGNSKSAHNPFGWTIVALSMVIPLVVAGISRVRPLLLIASIVAVGQFAIWYWALSGSGAGNC